MAPPPRRPGSYSGADPEDARSEPPRREEVWTPARLTFVVGQILKDLGNLERTVEALEGDDQKSAITRAEDAARQAEREKQRAIAQAEIDKARTEAKVDRDKLQAELDRRDEATRVATEKAAAEGVRVAERKADRRASLVWKIFAAVSTVVATGETIYHLLK